MKTKLLIILLLASLLGCKKEEVGTTSAGIKINYKVGDYNQYQREIKGHNEIINGSLTDTFEVLIPKDTIINNKNCLVYIKREKGYRDDISYLEQTDSSINAVGYWYNQANEVVIFDTPFVQYLNPLVQGTNWLTSILFVTERMRVVGTDLIKIDNHYYACMKIIKSPDISKKDDYSKYSYTEYLDAKGLVYSKEFFKTVYSYENGVPVDSSSLTFEIRRISK